MTRRLDRRFSNEPGHEKMYLKSYANNKSAEQTAHPGHEKMYLKSDQTSHPRSLFSAFIVRCLDSIISLDSIAKI